MTMTKEKTGSSKVRFPKESLKVEKSVYYKLIGDESHGNVAGFGRGMIAKNLYAKHKKSESKLLVKVLNKMMSVQKQIDVLTAKVATQAINSQPKSVHSTSKFAAKY